MPDTDPRTEARDELAHRWGAKTLTEAAAQELAHVDAGAPLTATELAREIRRHKYPRRSTSPVPRRPRNAEPDWVRIEKAINGQPDDLIPSEKRIAIDRLTRQGASINTIAGLLKISPREVSKYRAQLKAA